MRILFRVRMMLEIKNYNMGVILNKELCNYNGAGFYYHFRYFYSFLPNFEAHYGSYRVGFY